MKIELDMNDLPAEGIVHTTRVIQQINVRSCDRKVREAIRVKAYALFREGVGVCDCSRLLEVNVVTVSRWFKAFREGDCSLLKGKRRRGSVAGKRSILDKSQMKELRNMLMTKCPVDYFLPYRRWSFAAVSELVKMKFGKEVSRVTAGKWLASCCQGRGKEQPPVWLDNGAEDVFSCS